MVRRLQPQELPQKHRIWTGNDDKGRHYHMQIPRSESPLYIHLSWKAGSNETAYVVGCYELNMTSLLASGHIREDGPGHVRLRFVHADDGGIYIQARQTGPRFRADTI